MDKTEMIKALANYYTDGNKAAFARMLGISPQTLSSWSGRNIIDAELLYKKCKNVNAEWLLSGEGEMLRENTNIEVQKLEVGDKNSGDIFNGHNITIPDAYVQIKNLQSENNSLKRENLLLEDRIRDLKKNVEDLRSSKDVIMKILEKTTCK